MKPGASCLAVYDDFIAGSRDEPAADLVRRPRHRSAFARGPYIGKTPTLGRPGEDALIEEGMVLGFEPLCYGPAMVLACKIRTFSTSPPPVRSSSPTTRIRTSSSVSTDSAIGICVKEK